MYTVIEIFCKKVLKFCIFILLAVFMAVMFSRCRTRLKLFHPSKVECKSRCCEEDVTTISNSKPTGGDENAENSREFSRSDSLVIHEVPVNTQSSSTKAKTKSIGETTESVSNTNIQSILNSIHTETNNIQKFLTASEGKL